MTRAGDKDIEKGVGGGGVPKDFRHPKGGLWKKLLGGVGAPKKLNRWRGRLLRFQASSFNIFIPTLSY